MVEAAFAADASAIESLQVTHLAEAASTAMRLRGGGHRSAISRSLLTPLDLQRPKLVISRKCRSGHSLSKYLRFTRPHPRWQGVALRQASCKS